MRIRNQGTGNTSWKSWQKELPWPFSGRETLFIVCVYYEASKHLTRSIFGQTDKLADRQKQLLNPTSCMHAKLWVLCPPFGCCSRWCRLTGVWSRLQSGCLKTPQPWPDHWGAPLQQVGQVPWIHSSLLESVHGGNLESENRIFTYLLWLDNHLFWLVMDSVLIWKTSPVVVPYQKDIPIPHNCP